MKDDHKNIARVAQPLVIEYMSAMGSPPTYSRWRTLYDAKVDNITINYGAKPSVATIWFPSLRWNDRTKIKHADWVRIRTDQGVKSQQTCVFSGFVTADFRQFSGGNRHSAGHERNAIICQDIRWLLATTSPIWAQVSRSPDDYEDFGTPEETPKENEYLYLGGRRAIFNPDGRPNRDPEPLVLEHPSQKGRTVETPIFYNPGAGEYWTARQMVFHVLSPLWNAVFYMFPLWSDDIESFLTDDDWDKPLGHVVVDGLNVIEAVEYISRQIGWSFRIKQYIDYIAFDFFKLGGSSKIHSLYAPDVGKPVGRGVRRGKKLLWSMMLQKDITHVINSPIGTSSPQRFEFTAELVPAWKTDDLTIDVSDNYNNLFFTEAQLQDETDPNSKSYYKYYHVRGSSFIRNAARKWALNEAGAYTGGEDYDRGEPFDFTKVIPSEHIIGTGQPGKPAKKLYSLFNRQLLPCLTLDKEQLNSVGIRLEFSFDGGANWQIIPCSISALPGEFGIYIEEENLAEMVDESEAKISGGELNGKQLNYWTSLCDDIINERVHKDGETKTRVRVTASIQMDQRLFTVGKRQPSSGSPFLQRALWDFSQKHHLAKRTESSIYSGGDNPVYEIDSTKDSQNQIDFIRDANQDASISGLFVLERLWLGDGSGQPDFQVGDAIDFIEGRNFSTEANISGGSIYPEIVQIIYEPDVQHTKLITRDLRFAPVNINT